MYLCKVCGWRIFSDRSIVCPRCRDSTSFETPPNAWVVLHSRYAAAIESCQWNPITERRWLDDEFNKLVPCGPCGSNWLSLSSSIDLSTSRSAFRTSWEVHRVVSARHVQPPKPSITWAECQALYLQQRSLDDCCIAVTSLSRLPNHLAVQSRCLDTWIRAGLTIHAKNRSEEVDELQALYPQVDHWHICDTVPTEYKTRTQSIHSLAQTAVATGKKILLINSDIEIHGEQRIIREAVDDAVLVGIRHDYQHYWWQGSRFVWGLDVFSFTPEQALALPYAPFSIGKPVWDYWLPQHFRSIGQRMNFVGEPLFFHKLHPTNWSEAEWNMGAGWFADRFGFMRTQPESVEFRKSLPYPPT